MLKLTETRRICPRLVHAGQKVSRKYRMACIRRYAYRKLKAIVPAIANEQKVSKIKVIEEAIKYIDELHHALIKKAPQLFGQHSKVLPGVESPEQLVFHLLSSAPPAFAATHQSSSSVQPGHVTSSPCACALSCRAPCATCSLRRQIARRNM